jgi:hypothetical protein
MGGDLINQLTTNEYTDLFSDWVSSKGQTPNYGNYNSMVSE